MAKEEDGKKTLFPERKKGFIWRKMEDESVLFNPESNETYLLNQTAAVIWELCDGAHSLDDIANAIAENFETENEKAEIRQDVAEFVKEGEKEGYLSPSD